MLSSLKYLLWSPTEQTTHPVPLNVAGALLTGAVGSAERRKQPSYFQQRKRGDSLGFCRTKSALIARTPRREPGLPSRLSVCGALFKLVELQQGRWSFAVPLWSQRGVKSHILSVRLAQTLSSCASSCQSCTSHDRCSEPLCSRTPRTSDLPSAPSKKAEIRAITTGASKSSDGFPLGEHPQRMDSAALEMALPHLFIVHRATYSASSFLCLGITGRANSSSAYGQDKARPCHYPGPSPPSEFSRRGAHRWATCCPTLSHSNSPHSDTMWFPLPFQHMQRCPKGCSVRGTCASITQRRDLGPVPFSVP